MAQTKSKPSRKQFQLLTVCLGGLTLILFAALIPSVVLAARTDNTFVLLLALAGMAIVLLLDGIYIGMLMREKRH